MERKRGRFIYTHLVKVDNRVGKSLLEVVMESCNLVRSWLLYYKV